MKNEMILPMRQYQWLSEACEKLGITQTDFWNELLEDRSVQEMIRLARSVKYRPRVIKLEMDEDTRKSVYLLTEKTNALLYQTRALGRNIAHLLYDIDRRQLMNNLRDETLKAEAEMSKLLSIQEEISEKFTKMLYSDDGIKKREGDDI